MKIRVIVAVATMLLSGVGLAEDVDPDNDGSQYAFAANLGWINAEPRGNAGRGISFSADELRGWLWSANTGWMSLNCRNTSSCGDVDYRVAVSETGQLSGYAWSPNIGWVSFSCSDSGSCGSVAYGVEVDLVSGEMSGFGYAANTGWVSFSCEDTASCGAVDYGVRLDVFIPLFFDGFESS